ncbi:hypothetical protein [Brucella haematophila]|jgi:hypothetical protein|uniref:Uncharacterized protein n=1 Tax=Brucella haematophila TaxID=419474 RepID=A0ABX1DM82_9HYPH|nr:hypothetical protein [Brucella haematophila]NKC03901.1 hypothetical protein [Brucella haematophila]
MKRQNDDADAVSATQILLAHCAAILATTLLVLALALALVPIGTALMPL